MLMSWFAHHHILLYIYWQPSQELWWCVFQNSKYFSICCVGQRGSPHEYTVLDTEGVAPLYCERYNFIGEIIEFGRK